MAFSSNRIQPAPTDSNLDLTDLYVHTSSYDNNMFFLSSDKSTVISPRYDWSVFGLKEMYRVIERHTSNVNHSSHVSIYKHVPFFPKPDIDLSFLDGDAVLKAYEPGYDAYVFQQGNKLIWLIGADIDKSTEILFSLYTNRVDLLPPKRIQYGFDNLSFRVGDKSEKEKKGSYRHFEKDIPSQYPISFVRVGFNTNGNIIYSHDFPVTKHSSTH